MLAAVISTELRLPETYWAVLSAVIVSRPNAGGSAKAGASRLIGTVFGSVVAMAVLPSRGHGRVFRMGASIIARIGTVLESAFDEKRDEARLEAAHDDVRRDLRDLGVLVRTKVGRGAPRAQGRLVRLLSRLQADALFVGRVVGSGLRRDDAREYARFVHKTRRDLSNCMLDVESAEAELKRCAAKLSAAAGQFAQRGTHDALDFLLQTLGKDLHDLIRVLQGPK